MKVYYDKASKVGKCGKDQDLKNDDVFYPEGRVEDAEGGSCLELEVQ